jgi:hypothetical protein
MHPDLTLDEANELWRGVLADLKLQMTRPTFDGLLAGSTILEVEDSTLTVTIRNPQAVEWLTHRLLPTVERAVTGRAGRPYALHFLPAAAALPERGEEGAARGTGRDGGPAGHEESAPDAPDANVEIDLVADPALLQFDVATAGWSKLANYAVDYWSSLLGPTAFLTWLAIKSEDTRRTKTSWTPNLRFSVSRLARIAAGGNNQAISGVWRTCRSASILEHNRPCPDCAARQGRVVAANTCRYWRPGAFDTLQNERIAIIQRLGEGLNVAYRIRVFNILPLLTPAQVARLHPVTQESHDRWLRRQDLDAEQWERLTVKCLALPPFGAGGRG